MKITALKAQIKNPDRVSIFVDGKYSFSLTLDQVLEYSLKTQMEVSEADIAVFKKASQDGKLRMRAYEWLLNRPHSTQEFRDYLRRKKAEPDMVQSLIDEFTAKNVLSDARFTEWFTERAQRKHASARAVRGALAAKGIRGVNIAHDDGASLTALIAKLANKPKYADTPRLIRYLQSKGFAYGDIKEALKLQEEVPDELA